MPRRRRPVSGVYGGAYGDDQRWTGLVDGVLAIARRKGRKPKLFVAKMGQDGHDRGANLVSSAFGDLGFDVLAGPLFQTPKEAAEMAIAADVDVVGASSLAAGHKTLIPELIGYLRDAGRSDIKVIAGGVIPAQDYQFLRDAGVQAIFGPGTNLVTAAGQGAGAARPQHPARRAERGGGMSQPRTDWTRDEIAALFDLPFADLLFGAQTAHRAHHDANAVQLSTLLSIKTGGCAENCGYCSQSASFDTGLAASKLMKP